MDLTNYYWFNYCFENSPTNNVFGAWRSPLDANNIYTASEAAKQFNILFDKLCFKRENNKHLVPISGGFDSRAILAALVERIPIENIETISFGFSGQLDYEIGEKVSKALGIKKHTKFNLLDVNIDWSLILKVANNSPTTFHFDALFNFLSRTLFSDDTYIIWSGFMGDPLAGSHLILNEEAGVDLVLQGFVNKQKKINTMKFEKPNLSECISWIKPLIEKHSLRTDDVVNFSFRQAHCVAPIVLPVKQWTKWQPEIGLEKNGAQVIAPFIDISWARYWLYAPVASRISQVLYMDMLEKLFPDAMALPSKMSLGLSPKASKKIYVKSRLVALKAKLNQKFPKLRLTRDIRANYLDYGYLFRKRSDYISVLKKAFDTLIEHNLMSNYEAVRLFTEHKNASKNHADYFCLIVGIAANIEAGYI
ncbi:hypothetical protein [Methylophaga sp.]|uniref:hypothetical protein n=1 Tax=Methylophaga sp. TaxID=2024840 RepID=UPI003A8F6656